jgi:hypothetical protein
MVDDGFVFVSLLEKGQKFSLLARTVLVEIVLQKGKQGPGKSDRMVLVVVMLRVVAVYFRPIIIAEHGIWNFDGCCLSPLSDAVSLLS